MKLLPSSQISVLKLVLMTGVCILLSIKGSALADPSAGQSPETIFDSPVVLQIPGESSIGAVWAVKSLASGYIELSDTIEKVSSTEIKLINPETFYALEEPLKSLQERILSVRIKGLKPNTLYYYRAVTIPIQYQSAYKVQALKPEFGPINSFRTMGIQAPSSFAVINDTHSNSKTFAKLDAKLAQLNDAVTVWNGDTGEAYSINDAVKYVLNAGNTEFAVNRPVLFVPGNHDYRGSWTRNLDTILIKRNIEERDSRFAGLGRNFAVRQGDIALIGMDTGEDKPDNHPVFQGLAYFEPYRKLQTQWLEQVLEKPEIKSAPYIVVFCHIPLYDKHPKANPGDLQTGFADWQGPCSKMWSPLLKKYKVNLVVCAHMHAIRVDQPDSDRPWTQIVGGGPTEAEHASIIEGKVENNKLVVRVIEVYPDKIVNQLEFAPRDCP